MQKQSVFASLAAMSYVGFAFIQGYSIAQFHRKSLRLVLGSAFAPVLFGLLLAYFSGRLSGRGINSPRQKAFAWFSALAFAGFLFLQMLTIFHTERGAMKMVLASPIVPTFIGFFLAFFSGRLQGTALPR
jgi:membrane protein DedA with SNARE-associated domain